MGDLSSLLQATRRVGPFDRATGAGIVLLRVCLGALICYIHGWHKLVGGWAHVRDGAPWPLLDEIAEMGLPAAAANAWVATIVQFVCALLLLVGYYTRLNAALLTAVLAGAIAQNVMAGRDPQLALLYTIAVAAFVLIGAGPVSLDARRSSGG